MLSCLAEAPDIYKPETKAVSIIRNSVFEKIGRKYAVSFNLKKNNQGCQTLQSLLK